MAWGIGGWLLTPFLQKIGRPSRRALRAARGRRAQDHVRQPLHARVSLAEALRPRDIAVYGKHATGEKYLINPNKA